MLVQPTVTDSSSLQSLTTWLGQQSTNALRDLREELSGLTVAHIHFPPRSEVLKVLHDHGFESDMEELMDPDSEDYLFKDALAVLSTDAQAVLQTLQMVWDQEHLYEEFKNVRGFASTAGGTPQGTTGVPFSRVEGLVKRFHDLKLRVEEALLRQGRQDDAVLSLLAGAHATVESGPPQQATEKKREANDNLLTNIKKGKSVGMSIPKFKVGESFGAQLQALVAFCTGTPMNWGPWEQWLESTDKTEDFKQVLGIFVSSSPSLLGLYTSVLQARWRPSTPLLVLAAVLAPVANDFLNLDREREICARACANSSSLRMLVDQFTVWALICKVYTAASESTDIMCNSIQSTDCTWVMQLASEILAANTDIARKCNKLIRTEKTKWVTSPDYCLQLLEQLLQEEASTLNFIGTSVSSTSKSTSRRTANRAAAHAGDDRRDRSRRSDDRRDSRDYGRDGDRPRRRDRDASPSSPSGRWRDGGSTRQSTRSTGSQGGYGPHRGSPYGGRRRSDGKGSKGGKGAGRDVCWNLRDTGYCRFGNSCRFSHDGAPPAVNAPPVPNDGYMWVQVVQPSQQVGHGGPAARTAVLPPAAASGAAPGNGPQGPVPQVPVVNVHPDRLAQVPGRR